MRWRIPVSRPLVDNRDVEAVRAAVASGQLSYGPCVQGFEKAFARYVGVEYALATSSGTTALHLALAAIGIGPGDEVLVPDLTFVATANAVRYCGATPVLVDVEYDSWCMSIGDADSKVTDRTKAVIPVHLYGVPCPVPVSGGIVIEDAAEGLGGSHSGLCLGAIGDIGVFSFYGNKVMTTGEGGMLVTNNRDIYLRAYHLRGQAMDPERRYFHNDVGFNYRMTEMQGALGISQLKRLPEMLEARQAVVRQYSHNLYRHAIIPSRIPGSAPWLFTIGLPQGVNRDVLMETLASRGIETRPAFAPLHRMPMYCTKHLDRGSERVRQEILDVDFPFASSISDQGISLPTYPDLPLTAVDEICDVVTSHIHTHMRH